MSALRPASHDDTLTLLYDHALATMVRTLAILRLLGSAVIGVLVIATAMAFIATTFAIIAVPAVRGHHDCQSQKQDQSATALN
jgi:hypothetical protein